MARGVHWAPVFEEPQDRLWQALVASGEMDFRKLRRFLVHALGDASAYQINAGDRSRYDEVHGRIGGAMHELAGEAGGGAPLCVMAHSLGAMIASNYLWDLQKSHVPPAVLAAFGVSAVDQATPLERGETFNLFYTHGTTIPIWSLRYSNPEFGTPIAVPSPNVPDGWPRGWWNFYDEDDVLGYPIKKLNRLYDDVVVEDRRVSAGSWVSGWTPLSHTAYDTDKDLLNPIADALASTWRAANGF